MEILMALDDARRQQATVSFLRPRCVVNEALFELQAREVRIERPGAFERSVLATWWWHHRIVDDLRATARTVTWNVREQVSRELSRHIDDSGLPLRLRTLLRRARFRIAPPRRVHHVGRPYMRRQSMRRPLEVFLPTDVEHRMAYLATEVGIPHNAKLVVVHSRETGFKRGREVHDQRRKVRPRDDGLRNADIESYCTAIDSLVADGYTIVRLGDPSMKELRRPGVVDLATDARRVAALDIYCLLRSDFAVVGESGPGQAALLTSTPTLTVNATDPISSYPIRRDGLYILKTAVDNATGEPLSLRDMLGARYLASVRDPERFRYIDNTPEQILAAVTEMRALLRGAAPESVAQRDYRELATHAGSIFRNRLRYVRKFGTDDGFLGDGRIGREFIDTHL